MKVGAVGVPYHDIVERNGTLRPGPRSAQDARQRNRGHCGWRSVPPSRRSRSVRASAPRAFTPAVSAAAAATAWKRFARSAALFRAAMRNMSRYRRRRWSRFRRVSALRKPACSGSSTAVALGALRDIARVRLGDTVLVTGASGGVGLPAVEIAKAAGATVIAVTRSTAKRDALTCGRRRSCPRRRGRAGFLRRSAGADERRGRRHRRRYGRQPGLHARLPQPDDRRPLSRDRPACSARTSRSIRRGSSSRPRPSSGITSARRDQLEDTVRLVAAGKLHSRVARIMPLAEAAQAHALVESGNVIGRIVLAAVIVRE